MRFFLITEIIKENLKGANVYLALFLAFIVSVLLLISVWRFGAGFLLMLNYVCTALAMIGGILSGVGMLSQFLLLAILSIYSILNQKQHFRFSYVNTPLLLLPILMFFNSLRAPDLFSGFIQTGLFFAFYFGLIVAGQKILSTERNRKVFIRAAIMWLIFIVSIQIPYIPGSIGRFVGIFGGTVGFMLIGLVATILFSWSAIKSKVKSLSFVISVFYALLSLSLLVFTGGRTAVGAAGIALIILLSRRVSRNILLVIVLAFIIGPFLLKFISSYAGIEEATQKLFSGGTTGRLALWQDSLVRIMRNPLLGLGTGTGYLESLKVTGELTHNSYMMIAEEQGIPIALLILAVFAYLPVRGLLLIRKLPTEEMKNAAVLSSALLGAYLLTTFFGGDLYSTRGIVLIYTAVALHEGVWAEYKKLETDMYLQWQTLEFSEPVLDGYTYERTNVDYY